MVMNSIQRTCILLALISPLVLTSCVQKYASLSEKSSCSKQCGSGVNISVSAWRFTSSQAEELLKIPSDSVIPSLNSGSLRVIMPSQVDATRMLLNKWAEFITTSIAWTEDMQPLPVSVNNASEKLNAVVTPYPQFEENGPRMVSYELSSAVLLPKSGSLDDKSFNPGRVRLPSGGALLVVQHNTGGSIIWLIQSGK
ncbi:hypothetical protein [Pantoea vagans]|uniref:Lipoprotein n=1 Tax=Pantoea vagans TaxID=470934 RepID=A0AAN1NVC2_9GAMM|nr:hypothetical protein [Pantoea vagans]AVV40019.1 hypothetical protein C9381_22570 [Pantoea vagans]